jgi:transcriptional regulator of arginine metabolism
VSTKVHRQQLIAALIGEHPVTSQPNLLELLALHGVRATQATVSRDLDELGAVKVRLPGGDAVYAIPEHPHERFAPLEQLRRVMGEWVADVRHSGNLVVVRTPPGCAHVVGSALDRSGLSGLLGTVAGDDTLLCVADQRTGGAGLARRLEQLAGLAKDRGSST